MQKLLRKSRKGGAHHPAPPRFRLRHDWYAPLKRQQRGAAPAGEQPMRIAIDRAFRENTDGTAKREADADAGADRTA